MGGYVYLATVVVALFVMGFFAIRMLREDARNSNEDLIELFGLQHRLAAARTPMLPIQARHPVEATFDITCANRFLRRAKLEI